MASDDSRSIPDLHRAACRGHPELFDVERNDHDAIEAAQAICRTCPVLRACRAWLRSQPAELRPCGVVAGRYVAPPRLPRADYSLRVCVECGRGFMAKRWDARLCSAVCRMNASRARRLTL